MQRERKLWEKVLSLVLALVCCVGIVNLSPLAQEAKAASTVTIYYHTNSGVTLTKLWLWNNDGYGQDGSPEHINGGWYKVVVDNIPDAGFYFNPVVNPGNDLGTVKKGDNIIPANIGTCYAKQGESIIRTSRTEIEGMVSEMINDDGGNQGGSGNQGEGGNQGGTVAQGTRPTNYTEKTDNNTAIGSWANGAYSYGFTALDDSRFVNATHTDNPTKIAAASDDKLFVAPAVLYDYKESRPDKSNGTDIYTYNRDGQGSDAWGEPRWHNQFSDFDLALKREFYDVHTDITNKYYWMFVGACNTFKDGFEWPLIWLSQYEGNADEWASLWAANHNLNGAPYDVSGDVFINENTWRAAVAGLAGDKLNSKGNIVLGDTGYVMPFFDKDFLSQTFSYANGPMANIYENVLFPFRQTDDGYYEFRSFETNAANNSDDNDNFYYDTATGVSRYTYADNWCLNNDDGGIIAHPDRGFFPFNNATPADNDHDYKNFGNGVRIDIPFTLDPRTDGNDIVFRFAGDDDLWVYVDGYLALDLGGSHGMASGEINFSTQKSCAKDIATVNGKNITVAHNVYTEFPAELKAALTETSGSSAKKEHTLTVFYMERGLYDSNLHIQFNFTPIDYRQKNGLDVKNTVDLSGINPALSGKIKEDDFNFTYTVADKTYPEVKLYENDTVVINGTAGVHSDLEQEVTEYGSGSIRGDLMQVTQQANDMFTTSWSLYDTNGHTIMTNESSGLGNDYNVTDKKQNNDNFKLENKGGDGCDCPSGAEDSLLLTAQYVNRIKTTDVTIVTENAAPANLKQDTDLYNFKVTVKKLSGVDVEDFDYEGDYEVVNKTTGEHIRDSHTVNGKFTISENEKIVIKNVPVNSEILVTEVETDGTKTTSEQGYVSTDATHTGTKLGDTDTTNSKSYTVGNDTENSYDWVIKNNKKTVQITETDKTFFAEVGTQIVLDKELGDYTVGSKNELGLTGLSAGQYPYIDYVDQPAYDETVSREINENITTVETTKNGDQNYKDITCDIGQTLAAGKEYTVTLSSTHGGQIILRTVTLGDKTIDAVSADKSGNIVTENLDGKNSVTSIDGSLTFKFTPVVSTDNIGLCLKTWTKYPFNLKITYNDMIHHEAGHVPEEKTVNYDFYEKVVEISSNMDVSYGVPTTNTVNVTANGRTYYPGQIIYYTYPADKEPGEYDFTYKVQRVHAAPISIGGVTVKNTGDPIDSIIEVYDAKVYAYETNDDVYVIDYGLPVSLTADPNNMRDNDKLDITGVNTISYERGFISGATTVNSGVYTYNNYSKPFTGSYGTVAKAAATNVSGDNNATLEPQYKYTLNKFMDGVETFYVGQQVVAAGTDANAELDASNATPVMNAKITVVPATVVYYEDNFSYSTSTGTTSAIVYTNAIVVNNTGLNMVQSNDKDDIYGFDKVYINNTEDSNGTTVLHSKSGLVSFTFKGTGFDLISRASNASAEVLYVVQNANEYGHGYYLPGEFREIGLSEDDLMEMCETMCNPYIPTVAAGKVDAYYPQGTLYQVPMISVKNLEYGEYTVTFKISSMSEFDTFYFDGIRIYNPLGYGEENYYNSSEAKTMIYSIKDIINTGYGQIPTNSVEIGVDTDNELYFKPGNHFAFWVVPDASVAEGDRTLQVEARSIKDGLELTVNDITIATVDTATAMYYEIPVREFMPYDYGDRYLIDISSSGYDDAMLAISNLKVKGYSIQPYMDVNEYDYCNVSIKVSDRNVYDPYDVHEVQVTVDGEIYYGSYRIDGIPYKANRGIIKLFSGQNVLIENIPVGSEVKVEEVSSIGAGMYEIIGPCKLADTYGEYSESYDYSYELWTVGETYNWNIIEECDVWINVWTNSVIPNESGVFDIVVYVDGEPYCGEYTLMCNFGSYYTSDGRITINNMDSAWLEGIPVGSAIKVVAEENIYDGTILRYQYEYTSLPDWSDDYTNDAEFIVTEPDNSYNWGICYREILGSMNINICDSSFNHKSEDQYDILILMDGEPYCGSYNLAGNFYQTTNGQITLTADQSIWIDCIRAGTTVEVLSNDYSSDPYYRAGNWVNTYVDDGLNSFCGSEVLITEEYVYNWFLEYMDSVCSIYINVEDNSYMHSYEDIYDMFISVNGMPYSGYYSIYGMNYWVDDGIISIKEGQLITIEHIPTYSCVTVEELNSFDDGMYADRYTGINFSGNGYSETYENDYILYDEWGQYYWTFTYDNDACDVKIKVEDTSSKHTADEVYKINVYVDDELFTGYYYCTIGNVTRSGYAIDGIISVKAGQLITLEDIPVNSTISVVEKNSGIGGSKSDKYIGTTKPDGSVDTSNNGIYTVGSIDGETYTWIIKYDDDVCNVAVKVEDTSFVHKADDTYDINVYINWSIYEGKYSIEGEEGTFTTNNGKITVKEGQVVIIDGIPVGSYVKAMETNSSVSGKYSSRYEGVEVSGTGNMTPFFDNAYILNDEGETYTWLFKYDDDVCSVNVMVEDDSFNHATDDIYEVIITVDGELYTGEYTVDGIAGSSADGKIAVAEGQQIVLEGIPVNSVINVCESNSGEGKYSDRYVGTILPDATIDTTNSGAYTVGAVDGASYSWVIKYNKEADLDAYYLTDDSYVLDYGLAVNLSALDSKNKSGIYANDVLDVEEGISCTYLGISKDGESFSDSAIGTYGTVTFNVENGDCVYTPSKFINSEEVFYYGVRVSSPTESRDLTAQVSIVPASIVYYEDNFSYNTDAQQKAIIYSNSSAVVNNTTVKLQSNSNDDLYGYDDAYLGSTGDSLGTSAVLGDKNTVSFKFKGTGFDIIARAGNTASVSYAVLDSTGELVDADLVDTYCSGGLITQVPVISVKDLEYGEYQVKLVVRQSSGYSTFYFDGIRIYNPLMSDEAADTYKPDEYSADILSINELISGEFGIGAGEAVDFGTSTENELYFTTGNVLKFYVVKNSEVSNDSDRTLQIEARSVNNGSSVKLNGNVVKSASAMYYNLTLGEADEEGRYLVEISAETADDSALAVSNLKIKGYDMLPYDASADVDPLIITVTSTSGSSDISFKAREEGKFNVSFNKEVDIRNLSMLVNGQAANIRNIDPVEGVENMYEVTVLAPRVVGSFDYTFMYTGEIEGSVVSAKTDATVRILPPAKIGR